MKSAATGFSFLAVGFQFQYESRETISLKDSGRGITDKRVTRELKRNSMLMIISNEFKKSGTNPKLFCLLAKIFSKQKGCKQQVTGSGNILSLFTSVQLTRDRRKK